MIPDENKISAASQRVGLSDLKNKLDGRISEYRALCELHEQAKQRDKTMWLIPISGVVMDIDYLMSEMVSDGVMK